MDSKTGNTFFLDLVSDENDFDSSASDIGSNEDWDESYFETVIIENSYDTISDDEDIILPHLMTLDMRCYNVLGERLAPPPVSEVAPRWP